MSKISQSRVHVGDTVRLRGERWRVGSTKTFDDCESLQLIGSGSRNRNVSRIFLYPFDRPRPVKRRRTPTVVQPHRWLAALRRLRAEVAEPSRLQGIDAARIELHAYQLEPALHVLDGRGSRLLLADEVGLGKTIQAGILMRELSLRGWADRVLVVTPSGLMSQWRAELQHRFALSVTVMNTVTARTRSRSLPVGLSPWSLPGTYVASIDYVKRLDVLRPIEQRVWDLLVVDEAHLATPGSDRGLAIQAIATRARYVALLTATPHAGHEAAFTWLTRLGACGPEDPLLVYRRTRRDVGRGPRRPARLIPVRPTDAERRMHELVTQYATQVWRHTSAQGARLAMVVLLKRALSSAASLERSVTRRLSWLIPAHREPEQAGLPLDDPDSSDAQPSSALRSPGLANRRDERAWLEAIRDAARSCSGRESKRHCLARLLRRTNEPMIVFTEYRDTLLDLVAWLGSSWQLLALHGDMSREERHRVARSFNAGTGRILLATDVAGTGLNLQTRCRWIINYELPWNPMRLEQRIGRVDRLGQSRPVHAVHLMATQTAEQQVLAHVARRLERVRAAVGNVDHLLGSVTPESLAERALFATTPLRQSPPESRLGPQWPSPRPDPDASAERQRLVRRRQRLRTRRLASPGTDVARRPQTRWTRLRHATWPGSLVAACRVTIEDGLSMPVDQLALGCLIVTRRPSGDVPKTVAASFERAVVDVARRRLESAVRGLVRSGPRPSLDRHTGFLQRAIKREQELLRRIAAAPAPPIQPALFDRRALRRAAAERALRDRLERSCRTRLSRLRRAARLGRVRIEIPLVARMERRECYPGSKET